MPHMLVAADPAAALRTAAQTIRAGGVVIFPTETFYGLGVDPTRASALARLATIKERSTRKPVPLIAADLAACARLGSVPAVLQPLCAAFWPGPLTVAVEPREVWSPVILGGGKTIGVRVSSQRFARSLAFECSGLITSTSANAANRPPASTIAQLDPEVVAQVDLVLDAGSLPGGEPSTVVFARGSDVVLLRAGAISRQALESVLKRPVIVP